MGLLTDRCFSVREQLVENESLFFTQCHLVFVGTLLHLGLLEAIFLSFQDSSFSLLLQTFVDRALLVCHTSFATFSELERVAFGSKEGYSRFSLMRASAVV